jgi:hypothetical protein
MIYSLFEESSFVKLNCGCKIDEVSGQLSEECLPHREGNFIQ